MRKVRGRFRGRAEEVASIDQRGVARGGLGQDCSCFFVNCESYKAGRVQVGTGGCLDSPSMVSRVQEQEKIVWRGHG